MTRYSTIDSPVGPLTLTADDGHLTGVYFARHKGKPVAQDDWQRDDASAVLRQAKRQLDEYFAGKRTDFDLPLAPHGTPFQQSVWRSLLAIPFGRTSTYGELAATVGKPAAARAVGAAVGANPISIVVPCHRIIGKDGSLTGFGGGLDRKTKLLQLEGVLLA